MSNKTYDMLVIVAQLVLPALSAFILGFCETWSLPYGAELSGTVMLVDTFLGALLKYKSVKYHKEDN